MVSFPPAEILFSLVGACTVFFLLSWDMKRAADPTLRWTGDGIYAFALWEWILVLSTPLVTGMMSAAWISAPAAETREN